MNAYPLNKKVMSLLRRGMIAVTFVLTVTVLSAAQDPLPSWNDTEPKHAIINYVERVTKVGSADYVPAEDRIATVDNDGTLWGETPIIELIFIAQQVKALSETDEKIAELPSVKAVLTGDVAYLQKNPKDVLELFVLSHTDRSLDDFKSAAESFTKAYKDSKSGRSLRENRYKPMLELLNYLRANDFDIWICTGGTQDFVGVVSQSFYKVSADHVIGTQFETEKRVVDGKTVTWILPKMTHWNDKEGKPVGIKGAMGDKRPIFTAGNEGGEGDIAMSKYSQDQKRLTFHLIINHNDASREARYNEPTDASLMAALRNGWMVVSMLDDWKVVFASEKD